jgi:hypothetical protein
VTAQSTATSAALCYLPAHRQRELFRRKELSPADVLTAQMERVATIGPSVNAITFSHFDEAIAAAKESETPIYDKLSFNFIRDIAPSRMEAAGILSHQ